MRNHIALLSSVMLWASAVLVQAAELTIFVPGTPARAEEVNDNFAILKGSLDSALTAGSCPEGGSLRGFDDAGGPICTTDVSRCQEQLVPFGRVGSCDLSATAHQDLNLFNTVLDGANFSSTTIGSSLTPIPEAADPGFSPSADLNAGHTVTRSSIRDSSARNADFSNAVLTDVAFTGTDLSGARFVDAQIVSSNSLHNGLRVGFSSLATSNLSLADFLRVAAAGASFAGADAIGTRFANSNLVDTTWFRAVLSRADFTGAQLDNASITLAHV